MRSGNSSGDGPDDVSDVHDVDGEDVDGEDIGGEDFDVVDSYSTGSSDNPSPGSRALHWANCI